jgi:hypothetical protein
MFRVTAACVSLLLIATPALADETPQDEAKTLSGMSILGNDEAPTSLVIVPWKGSEIGAKVGLSNVLNAGIQAVDKDVFLRELSYYDIRSKE